MVVIPPAEVDARGLHVCNLAAMRRALASLADRPEYVLTDGFPVDGLGVPGLAVWKGDQVAACVAAASVLAKVTRDRIMVELDERFPAYGFAEHKGYVTAGAQAALRRARAVRRAPVLVRQRGRGLRSRRPAAARRRRPGDAAGRAEPMERSGRAGGTVGVASGERPRPPVPVGEDVAMEGG